MLNRVFFRYSPLSILLASSILFTSCGAKSVPPVPNDIQGTQNLNISIVGLPAGISGDVTITGPGFRQSISGTQSLKGLAIGTYTVTAATVDSIHHPWQPIQTITLSGSGTQNVTVGYPKPAFAVEIPDISKPGTTVSMEFVLVPAGSFTMGTNQALGPFDGKPAHPVTFATAYYIAKTECTQAQWKAVKNANPSKFSVAGGGSSTDDLHRPVERVSWDDIQKPGTGFVAMLNAAMPGYDFSLPTEAEWERACRAGTSTIFSFGDDGNQLGEFAWIPGNSGSSSHPVGTKPANPWGLLDMHGNVWEWCLDDWHETYNGAPANGSAWIDSPRSGVRVMRGGAWEDIEGYGHRSTLRHPWFPDGSGEAWGFRLVARLPRGI